MLVVIAVILVGFWPSYWTHIGKVPWQFHAHGAAASLWVAMVTVQCWTSQSKKQLDLHRAIGRASLFLFPFLIAGLAAILDISAKGYASGEPVRVLFGPTFMVGILIAMAAYVTLFYGALKQRRKVWDHAGYMLATPLILFESPFSRVLGMFVPAFTINGPQDFNKLVPSILWSMALELAFIAVVWLRVGARARPFLVAGAFIVAQMVAMGMMGDMAPVKALEVAIGAVPSALVVLTGFAIGAATSWLGWQAGKKPGARMATGRVQVA
jgi:hypothetical protein